MRARSPAALLLFAFLALAAYRPSPVVGQTKDPPKIDPKADPKANPKTDSKEPSPDKKYEPKWPSVIAGKSLHEWLKDATENPDPAIREGALKTLPGFGPDARKVCSKKLLTRMTFEKDPGVRITVFNTAAVLGLEDADIKPAVQILARIVDEAAPAGSAGCTRSNAALIGTKAEEWGVRADRRGVQRPVVRDPPVDCQRPRAGRARRVHGPNQAALNKLAGGLARTSAAVRTEAPVARTSPARRGPGRSRARRAGAQLEGAEFVAERMPASALQNEGAGRDRQANRNLVPRRIDAVRP